MKILTVSEISQIVEGNVFGDLDTKLNGISTLDDATNSDLSFLFASAPREMRIIKTKAKTTKAGAVLVSKYNPSYLFVQIVVNHPLLALSKIANIMYEKKTPNISIHPSAIVDPSAEIHPNVCIGALSVIGANVKIDKDTIVFPHVVIYDGVTIGTKCIIHANAVLRENVVIKDDCVIQNGVVIGSDGFGYIPVKNVGLERIPHIGKVVIENGVDVGANTTIDRATFGKTEISTGTKIDNLVMIGHNVKIGSNSILCGQVGIAGSSSIGNNVVLAGQVGVADHVCVSDNVRVAAKSGIAQNISSPGDYAGIPAKDAKLWKREVIGMKDKL